MNQYMCSENKLNWSSVQRPKNKIQHLLGAAEHISYANKIQHLLDAADSLWTYLT